MKILIIEDDSAIGNLVLYNLKQEKYEAKIATRAKDGLREVKQWRPDLIVLDLMLQDMSGLDVCRTLKSNTETNHIPIVMLTAKSEEIDRIVGFEVGADDYITKPFSPRELVLRVKAVLKRKEVKESPGKKVKFKEMVIDYERHCVVINKKVLELTLTEFKLLAYLVENKERVLQRDSILNYVWGYSTEVFSRTVDAHVTRLRDKLGNYGKYIKSVRGLGYCWKE